MLMRQFCAASVRSAVMGLLFVAALCLSAATELRAQTYKVLHAFNGRDGSGITAGVIMDRAGNLYGTTYFAGAHGYGEVYRLQRAGSEWHFSIIYSFAGGSDGAHPWGALVFGRDGSLYGTTFGGGNGGCGSQNFGCGTVYRLRPPVNFCNNATCSWTETVLYRFSGGADGAGPRSDVSFDRAGNLYGTTLG